MTLRTVVSLVLVLALASLASSAAAQGVDRVEPVVRGALFFSPACGHCEIVINDHLPGILDRFGDHPELRPPEGPSAASGSYLMRNDVIELLLVDVSTPVGSRVFDQDSERLGISAPGVPRLDIGQDYLVGSRDIPDRLPGLIEAALSEGGADWPAIPGIEIALAGFPDIDDGRGFPSEMRDGGDVDLLPASTTSIWDRLGADPVANGLAIVVLVGLIVSLAFVPYQAWRGRLARGPWWLVPSLALVGVGVSVYMGVIEATGAEAVCGPVGDCNTVQQSDFAVILGVPVGVLGLIAYSVVLVAWIASRIAPERTADVLVIMMAAIALGGAAFSVYLTFLEPFVIGATCAWCLTSALAIAGLLWATAGSGWSAIDRLRERPPRQPRLHRTG